MKPSISVKRCARDRKPSIGDVAATYERKRILEEAHRFAADAPSHRVQNALFS